MNARFLAALMILIAVLALIPPRGRGLHRLAAASTPTRRPSRGGAAFARSAKRRLQIVAAAVIIALAVGLSLGLQLVVSALAVGAIVAVITTQRSASRHRALATQRRTQIIEACDVLSADLTAGRPPAEALEGAATICPDLTPAATAARLGGDVPAVLDLATESPGAESLKSLSAAWQVAEESGASLAATTERLSATLRSNEAIRRQITTNLAGARTTARLLAILPLFGTTLGYALGADPLTFLTTTPPGYLCLALGLALAIIGLHWTNHLATLR